MDISEYRLFSGLVLAALVSNRPLDQDLPDDWENEALIEATDLAEKLVLDLDRSELGFDQRRRRSRQDWQKILQEHAAQIRERRAAAAPRGTKPEKHSDTPR